MPRQLIVFIQNVHPLLIVAPAPPQLFDHQPHQPLIPQPAETKDPLPTHQPPPPQPLIPQPAESEDPLPTHQPPPPQPLRRSQRVRRAPQRLTFKFFFSIVNFFLSFFFFFFMK